MSRKRQNHMHQATTAFSKYIRERDGQCVAVGSAGVTCKGHLQCCHIVGRGELSLRLDEDNAITMCQAHHRYYTDRDAQWHDYIEAMFPGRWDELWQRARTHRASGVKIDWEAKADYWSGVKGTV